MVDVAGGFATPPVLGSSGEHLVWGVWVVQVGVPFAADFWVAGLCVVDTGADVAV